MAEPPVIYFNEHASDRGQSFKTGWAWWVAWDPSAPWYDDKRFAEHRISAPLYQALFSLGVLDGLSEVPGAGWEGLMGAFEDCVLLNRMLPAAAAHLRRCASDLEPSYDWQVSTTYDSGGDLVVTNRIAVEGPRLERELLTVAEFIGAGAARGYDVQLWL